MAELRTSSGILPVMQAWGSVQTEGALIVDLRGPSEFAMGHPKGALSLPHSEKGLLDRLGVVLQPGRPIILMTETPRQTQSAVSQLQEGAFPLVGVIEDAMISWGNSGLPTEVVTEISVSQLANGDPGDNEIVLDVREPMEWATGHIPGAFLISLSTLRERLHELPFDSKITVICEAGVRSSSAVSILQAEGFAGVVNVPEGTGGYRSAGLPLGYFPEETEYDRVS